MPDLGVGAGLVVEQQKSVHCMAMSEKSVESFSIKRGPRRQHFNGAKAMFTAGALAPRHSTEQSNLKVLIKLYGYRHLRTFYRHKWENSIGNPFGLHC